MVNFQEEFVSSIQNDERIHTFVVHVPTLGAQEENVPGAMSLLDGPRVSHYWNGTGEVGWEFSRALGIGETYAWDVWMIYPGDMIWESALPSPAYWQHQIGVDQGDSFDPPHFAEEMNRYAGLLSP